MKKSTLIAIFTMVILLMGFHSEGWTQLFISSGNNVSENFDGMGGSATATVPLSWKVDKNTTVRTVGIYSAALTATERNGGNNMSTTASNGIYNYGAGDASTASDRAVGGLSSGTASKSVNVYVQLLNNGTTSISQFQISYNVEKYRKGSNASGFSIQMYYSSDGIAWTSAGPNFLTSFTPDADNTGYTTAPGLTTAVSAQTLSQTVAVGANLYLAWNYSVTSGSTTTNAQALGVDDISITADPAGGVVESPVFTPPPGNYFSPQNIAITCATPGATIYYTTNGVDPDQTSTVYTTPIALSVNTTLKAKAYLTGMTASSITSGLYRFPIDVPNIAALRAGLTDGTIYRLTGEAIVTYQRPDFNRNQMYIQDATAAIVVDDVPLIVTNDFNIGDGVTNLTGTLTLFNSLLELSPLVDPGLPSSTGNAVTPLQTTLNALTSADQAKLVSLPFTSFTSPTGNYVVSTNYPVTDASGSGTFRTLFAEADYLGTPIPTTPQNIVALVGQSGTTIQITSRFASDITPAAPSWTSGWPKAENASQTVFNAKVNINVPGTSYFVVLPNGAAAPTAQQVKDGQDNTGTPVASNLAGTIICTLANTEYVAGVTGLTPATTYNVYFVAEASGNLQVSPVMVPVTTTLGGTAPVVINPTAVSINTTSAVLGGNITSDGGQSITERGTVWSITSPVTIDNNKLAEGGTVTGLFSHTRSGLPVATQIFYAAYATNAIGTSLTSEGSFFTLDNEPTNHATAFTAGTITTTTIQLNWTDATGGTVPTGYLIKGSDVSLSAIVDPVDGTAEANSALVQNVNPGVGTYTFTGLAIGTPYYFKIYPYNGTAATINYKTSVTVPEVTASTSSAGVYTWIGGNGTFSTSTNWTPVRSTPAPDDILQFSDGGTDTVTAVPTQTIGQLKLSGNTTVYFSASAASTLTIAGLVSGADLTIAAGSSLNIIGTSAITLAVGTGATASIDGNMSMSSTALTAHRLTGASASGNVVFNSGSSFRAGFNLSGAPFGTTALNSVIFANGSTFIHQGGSSPFGASQPSSVVVFQTGSLYKAVAAVTPSYSGRTYANVEYDFVGGTFNQTGGSAVVMDNLTVTNGTLNFNVTGTPGHTIKGNIAVANGGKLNFAPTTAGTVKLGGTALQTISGAGKITSSSFSTLDINNAGGVSIENDSITLSGALALTNGLVTLGSHNLTFGATGTITGTPSAANMIVATGTGELRKIFTATGNFTYPVGDNSGTAEYSPVLLTITAGSFTSAYMGVNLTNTAYPGVTGNFITRYWNVSASGIAGLAYDAQLSYLTADVVGTESSMVCALMSPPTNYAAANTTLHQLNATGVTTGGTFTGKDPFSADKSLSITVFLEGLYAGAGTMNQAYDELGPHFPAGVADQITIELRNASTGAVEATLSNIDLSITGQASATVSASHSGYYYIYVKHRNSIVISTADSISFAGAAITYDFSNATSQVFGNNVQNLGGGIYGMFAGDENQDGLMDSSDMIDADNDAAAFATGYLATDVNGDGLIDSSDMILIDNNATAFVAAVLPF
jgi:hypothetical protein